MQTNIMLFEHRSNAKQHVIAGFEQPNSIVMNGRSVSTWRPFGSSITSRHPYAASNLHYTGSTTTVKA